MPAIHHVGVVVVKDLDREVGWWCEALDAVVVKREAWTDANPEAIGLPGTAVRLQGALLRPRAGGSCLELHEFASPTDGAPISRRTHEHGLGHVALAVPRTELEAEGQRLAGLGVAWLTDLQEIAHGALKGVLWRYGNAPSGVRIEMTWWPELPEAGTAL